MNDFFLTCKECVLESPRSFYGCFYLGPFNASQSLTVANGLRRTLLSEISGLGIQNVEIDGVEHEYSTFPGIRESILDLLLNLKEIVLLRNSKQQKNSTEINDFVAVTIEDSNQVGKGIESLSESNFGSSSTNALKEFQNRKPFYGYLQVSGPGIVRASDLKLPPSIQCVDPDQYIATLTENGKLNLRFTICEGRIQMQKNSSSFYDNKMPPHGLNESSLFQKSSKKFVSKQIFKKSKVLWLDPIFTPILKVNYAIESYGSSELNPTNQVVLLELWTNGSLHPREALYNALNQLNSIFSKLEKMKILNNIFAKSILKSDKTYSKMIKKVQYDYNSYYKNQQFDGALRQQSINQKISSHDLFETNESWKYVGIDVLKLPFRVKNCLIQANLLTVKDVLDCKIEDLKKISGFGTQSLNLLEKKLNEKGLKLNK